MLDNIHKYCSDINNLNKDNINSMFLIQKKTDVKDVDGFIINLLSYKQEDKILKNNLEIHEEQTEIDQDILNAIKGINLSIYKHLVF